MARPNRPQPPFRVVVMVIGHATTSCDMARGILQFCRDEGHWQVHFEGATDEAAQRRGIEALTEWHADGVIADIVDPRFAGAVHESGIPAIDIGNTIAAGVSLRCVDNAAVGCLAARYFLGRGFREFAFFGYPDSVGSALRYEGFSRELAVAGLRCRVLHSRPLLGQSDWLPHESAREKWLTSLPPRSAILANNDNLAREIIWGCERLGRAVPDDLAVMGVDDDDLECSLCPVPIASVAWPARAVGFEAARTLDSMMRGQKAPERFLLPPSGVHVRRSADSYAIDDEHLLTALRLIRERAHEPLAVKDILQAVPLSRRSLESRFVKLLARTPGAEILAAHLDIARRLLAETDLKMPEVARQSGFSPHQVFSRIFRKAAGMTPTEYRLRFSRR